MLIVIYGFLFLSFLIYFCLCTCVCICVYTCTSHMQVLAGPEEDIKSPRIEDGGCETLKMGAGN